MILMMLKFWKIEKKEAAIGDKKKLEFWFL
jgi:hypothetical protein